MGRIKRTTRSDFFFIFPVHKEGFIEGIKNFCFKTRCGQCNIAQQQARRAVAKTVSCKTVSFQFRFDKGVYLCGNTLLERKENLDNCRKETRFADL